MQLRFDEELSERGKRFYQEILALDDEYQHDREGLYNALTNLEKSITEGLNEVERIIVAVEWHGALEAACKFHDYLTYLWSDGLREAHQIQYRMAELLLRWFPSGLTPEDPLWKTSMN